MPNKRILLQWIGHGDLRAMAASLPAVQRDQILAEIKGVVPGDGDIGPTKTLLDTQSFDEIWLLSNYRTEWTKLYRDWLGGEAKLVRVELKKPTDYVSISGSPTGSWPRSASGRIGRRSSYVCTGAERSVWFDAELDGSYTARYGAKDTLVHDAQNHLFILTREDGSRCEFFDMEQTAHPQGGLYRWVKPGGATIEVSDWVVVGADWYACRVSRSHWDSAPP